jgi:hypothetical protein
LGDNLDTIKKIREAIIDASKEVDLQENAEKLNMLLSGHQSAWQSHDIKRDNRAFEYVANFKYLGTTITMKICFIRELKADCIPVLRATIQFGTFYLLVYHLNTYKFQNRKL